MEPRWHVTVAVAVLVGLQVTLAVTFLGAWARGLAIGFGAVELAAGVVLLWANLRGEEHTSPGLRRLSLGVVVLASLVNLVALVFLIDRLLGGGRAPNGSELTAGSLLGTGGLVWLSNVIVFGLWYWELDRRGPAQRATGVQPVPDFLFPQMTAQHLFMSWEPRFADYLYTSWTNATAFSPTDTLPTSRWAKFAMMLQSGISLVTAALVIARAVNILR
jgi:uncharacterized membrane protein